MAVSQINNRQAAFALLNGVILNQKPLLELSVDAPPPIKAAGRRLAVLTLRRLTQIDAILAKLLTRKAPPHHIMNILRLMVAEILFSDVPDYAAVDGAVGLAKSSSGTVGFKGLTNALGRRMVRERDVLLEGAPEVALPSSFVGQMKTIFDGEALELIAQAHLQTPPVDLSLKDQTKADYYTDKLGAELLPTGSLRIDAGQHLSALEGFDQGDWWVQDAAAATAAKCFDDLNGKQVLDLCAAPGGKTLQLAAMGAKVTALDLSEDRLMRVHENLARTELSAEVICADALDYAPDQKFDAILLDAPCSASGTLRRHPDLMVLKPNMDIGKLLELQRQLLAHAVGLLAPKGQLVYATCSLFAAEAERQALYATQELGLTPVPLSAGQLGLSGDQVNAEGQIRLAPHQWADRGGLDGFFVTKFQAKG